MTQHPTETTEEVTVNMTTEEGTTEEVSEALTLQRAKDLFGANNQIHAVKKIREEIQSQRLTIGDNGEADKLGEMVKNLSPEEIRALSDSAINEIYNLDGEGSIESTLDLTPEKEMDFKRDFLVYVRETDIANASFDEELEKLEAEIAEHQDELKVLLEEFGDLSTFMRGKLQEEFDNAEGERKEKLAEVLTAYDDSYTLNRVYEHYQKFGTKNTISDSYHRSVDVFTRYVKVARELNFNTELTSFNNLEKNFLDEKYHEHPNLFLFSIIKLYAYKKNASKNTDGVFLSQLAVNLKSLYSDSFGDDDKKETFLNSIRKVLDLFID